MKNLLLCLAAICLFVSSTCAAQPSGESQEQRDARMKWWREARFGMFIHWGLYAIPAGEWNGKEVKGIGEWIMHYGQIPVADYEKLASQFNPTKFDAKKIAQTAKDAGMKYIVITSKHHDGFALFDSKVSQYDVMDATPFKRDILKELADATREQGLKMCWYHSIMDWHHPDAQAPFYPKYSRSGQSNPNFQRYVDNYLKPQVKELLTNYGPIGVMWFDGEWVPEWTEEMGKDMYAYCRSIQPDVIVNNRVGKGRKGMQGMSRNPDDAGDFGTPEQEVPPTGFPPGVDWESCMTMNKTWGFKKNDHEWKSKTELIRTLIETASKGGNFLLNVGPTAEGEIPDASVERLAAIGKWMKVNGESIYGSSASPFEKLSFGRATQKGNELYLHVFDWPKDGKLLVPLKNKPAKAYLLAKPDSAVETMASEQGLTLHVGDAAPDEDASVIVLELTEKPEPYEQR